MSHMIWAEKDNSVAFAELHYYKDTARRSGLVEVTVWDNDNTIHRIVMKPVDAAYLIQTLGEVMHSHLTLALPTVVGQADDDEVTA